MKYQPIQINGEWFLREENTYTQPWVKMAYKICEERCLAEAKPIINHDGREWYDEKDLESYEQFQYKSADGWVNGVDNFQARISALPLRLISAWKYIGEKPVEKPVEKESCRFDIHKSASWVETERECYAEGIETERDRITCIIRALFPPLEVSGYNQGFGAALRTALTKINS